MSDIEQKLLTAKGDELSRLLGCVLQSEICRKCILCVDGQCDKRPGQVVYSCNDIPLNDWNVAMKWRDWAVAEYGEVKFKQAMIDVYSTTTERLRINFSSWLALYAQPEHYLIAAALCKLKGNEDAN